MTREDYDTRASQCLLNIETLAKSIRSTASVHRGIVGAIHSGYGYELAHNITAIRTNLRVLEKMFKGAY
jgi:hypothetical protein